MLLRLPRSSLFPYTTLFRSARAQLGAARAQDGEIRAQLEQAERDYARSQRSEEHTSELQSRQYLVCRLLLEKKNITNARYILSATSLWATVSCSNRAVLQRS